MTLTVEVLDLFRAGRVTRVIFGVSRLFMTFAGVPLALSRRFIEPSIPIPWRAETYLARGPHLVEASRKVTRRYAKAGFYLQSHLLGSAIWDLHAIIRSDIRNPL